MHQRYLLLLLGFFLFGGSHSLRAQVDDLPGHITEGLTHLEENEATYVDWLIRIGSIVSPSGQEQERAEAVANIMRDIGLQDVRVDEQPNAIGVIPGKKAGKIVYVSTLDDLAGVAEHQRIAERSPYREGDRLLGPGTNTSSITVAMLAAAEAWVQSGVQPEHTLVFVAVAQEETGLKGMKALVDQLGQEATIFVDILGDGRRLTYGAIGIHWWKVVVSGPPGHTLRGGFPDQPHVNKAIGRAVDRILQLPHPVEHRDRITRLNVGMIHSGTVYNHKPDTGYFTLDLRSLDEPLIEDMEQAVQNILTEVSEETGTKLEMEPFQITRGGQIPGFRDSNLVVQAIEVSRYLGYEPELSNSGSSNMNIAINQSIPAIGLGGSRGGQRGFADEWADIPAMMRAAKHVFLYAHAIGVGE